MPTDDQSELFIWVDEADHELGKITRQEAHSGSRKIHRTSTILIVNQDKTKILFQKRSLTKDLNPGLWSCGVGGHVAYGDGYRETAIRELDEELGIQVTTMHLFVKQLCVMEKERELMSIYEAVVSDEVPLKPDPTEVSQVEWCKISDIDFFISSHSMSPNAKEIIIQMGYL